MGGTSTQQGTQSQIQNTSQAQNQTQSTTPWAPGAGVLSSIFGTLQGINPNLSPTQTSAIANLSNLGGQGSPWLSGVNSVVGGLLGGGGANTYAPAVQAGLQNMGGELAPYLDPNYLDPMKTPGLGTQLQTTSNDILQGIRNRFAGAGRTDSGDEQIASARGLAQGLAPILTNQYNTNVGTQLGAINSLFNAGNTSNALLSGLQQQAVANQTQGIGAAGNAFSMSAAGPELQLQALSQQTGIPLNILAQEMGIALPATTGFGTTTGSGTSTGTTTGQGTSSQTNQMSGAQQFALLASAFGNMMGRGSSPTQGGMGILGIPSLFPTG
jgi:hypothetical protein